MQVSLASDDETNTGSNVDDRLGEGVEAGNSVASDNEK